jgi:DNA-binding HxlR family transcriptional regulator
VDTNASANSELSYRQAIEDALRLLDGDWVVAVLIALAAGPLHMSELVAAINAVEERVGRRLHKVPLSRQVLSPTLTWMVEAGLLVKTVDPTPHPSTWYRLTPIARSLLSALLPLAEWAQGYRKQHPAPRWRRRSANAQG